MSEVKDSKASCPDCGVEYEYGKDHYCGRCGKEFPFPCPECEFIVDELSKGCPVCKEKEEPEEGSDEEEDLDQNDSSPSEGSEDGDWESHDHDLEESDSDDDIIGGRQIISRRVIIFVLISVLVILIGLSIVMYFMEERRESSDTTPIEDRVALHIDADIDAYESPEESELKQWDNYLIPAGTKHIFGDPLPEILWQPGNRGLWWRDPEGDYPDIALTFGGKTRYRRGWSQTGEYEGWKGIVLPESMDEYHVRFLKRGEKVWTWATIPEALDAGPPGHLGYSVFHHKNGGLSYILRAKEAQ